MRSEMIMQAEYDLQQLRLAEKIALDDRLGEIAEKVPAVMDVRAKLAQTSVQISKLVLSKSTDIASAIEKIRDANLALQAEEKRLLREAGYPEDYLKLKVHCPFCQDEGYKDGVRCECLKARIRQLELEKLNAVSSLRLTGFDDFDLRYYPETPAENSGRSVREWMGRVAAYCRTYAERFTPQSGSLLLFGGTGLGKTHLSLAIAAEVIRGGHSVVYGSAQDFLRKVEKEHFHPEKNGTDTLEGLLDCDLLILDDLGAEFSTQFTRTTVNSIISSRLNREKATIISTNLTRAEMEEMYGTRVVSRIYSQYGTLKFLGSDIRQMKRR
ncbi:MAG: ATP-binding protein [Oscillospiraceae bacterium]|nr:ATP-binding protein [Oscillospiraceae bacterium]